MPLAKVDDQAPAASSEITLTTDEQDKISNFIKQEFIKQELEEESNKNFASQEEALVKKAIEIIRANSSSTNPAADSANPDQSLLLSLKLLSKLIFYNRDFLLPEIEISFDALLNLLSNDSRDIVENSIYLLGILIASKNNFAFLEKLARHPDIINVLLTSLANASRDDDYAISVSALSLLSDLKRGRLFNDNSNFLEEHLRKSLSLEIARHPNINSLLTLLSLTSQYNDESGNIDSRTTVTLLFELSCEHSKLLLPNLARKPDIIATLENIAKNFALMGDSEQLLSAKKQFLYLLGFLMSEKSFCESFEGYISQRPSEMAVALKSIAQGKLQALFGLDLNPLNIEATPYVAQILHLAEISLDDELPNLPSESFLPAMFCSHEAREIIMSITRKSDFYRALLEVVTKFLLKDLALRIPVEEGQIITSQEWVNFIKKLTEQLSPIQVVLEKYPQNIVILNNIAESYSANCVNQQMFGVTVACIVAKLCEKHTKEDFIFAARCLRLVDAVTAIANEKSGAARNIEVEIANQSLKLACKSLISSNKMTEGDIVFSERIPHIQAARTIVDDRVFIATSQKSAIEIFKMPAEELLTQFLESSHFLPAAEMAFGRDVSQELEVREKIVYVINELSGSKYSEEDLKERLAEYDVDSEVNKELITKLKNLSDDELKKEINKTQQDKDEDKKELYKEKFVALMQTGLQAPTAERAGRRSALDCCSIS